MSITIKVSLSREKAHSAFKEYHRFEKEEPLLSTMPKMFISHLIIDYKYQFGAFPGADYIKNGVIETQKVAEFDDRKAVVYEVPWIESGYLAVEQAQKVTQLFEVELEKQERYSKKSHGMKRFDDFERACRWVEHFDGEDWIDS